MAKPWESTYAKLVDKKMTPDPKRVELDIHGDPITLNPVEYDIREYHTDTGLVVREPILHRFGVDYARSGDVTVRSVSIQPTSEEIHRDMKRILVGLSYRGHPDLDYRKDPMYSPKPKFDNTPQDRQKERLYDKKPAITAKEANEWLASLPPVESLL